MVVHDAADIISSFLSNILLLTPLTIFLIFPFAGAVKITFFAPDFKCLERPSSSLHAPVLSITIGFKISWSL